MKLVKYIILLNMLCVLVGCSVAKKSNRLTDYVNPFIGTATLWDSTELGISQPDGRGELKSIQVPLCRTQWYK